MPDDTGESIGDVVSRRSHPDLRVIAGGPDSIRVCKLELALLGSRQIFESSGLILKSFKGTARVRAGSGHGVNVKQRARFRREGRTFRQD